MKIDKTEVVVTSPDRNFVTLRLTTDDGLVGLGDATLNGRELAVVAYLTEHVVPTLIGRDAHRIEDTWQFLYRGSYWRRGPVTMAAIAAVDVALWDLKAKSAGMPLYQLLGGASRTGLLAYGHASGKDIEELFDSIRLHLNEGYRAVRIQAGVPGLKTIYGVASNAVSKGNEGKRYDREPARRASLPTEEDWDTRSYLRLARSAGTARLSPLPIARCCSAGLVCVRLADRPRRSRLAPGHCLAARPITRHTVRRR